MAALDQRSVIQHQRRDVGELATVVGVVVKDKFVDEHFTPTHISHRSLSQHKSNGTCRTVGFTQTHNKCNLLAGQFIDGAIG